MLGGARHHVENGVAALVAGGDVEEGQFIGARCVIGDGRFHRIAGIAQVNELHALDDTAAHDVEAGNEAGLQTHAWLP
ncbi:hypothetical protein D3C87_1940140 [compost metagenome]